MQLEQLSISTFHVIIIDKNFKFQIYEEIFALY